MNQQDSKQKVREFYDEIGWSMESSGHYQNARYEDLRPVSAEYIHKCHMRITPYFAKGGKWGDKSNYDMCVNSTRLGLDGTVEFLANYIQQRLGK